MAEPVAEPEADPVRSRRDGSVLTLTLDRPHRLNAVSQTLYDRLLELLEAAEADPDVRCVVLTGAGRAFCAGADLQAHAETPMSEAERAHYAATAQRVNLAVQEARAPVVAAVNGHAIGAGLELALSADLIVVADEAKLRLPEVALGTFVGGGVTYTLPERVGASKARELVLLGDFFSGAEAARIGLANRAVPADRVVVVAMELAGRLAANAPLSMAAAKRLLGRVGGLPRAEALELEREALEEIFGTDDWREGVAAWREGRPARYRGA